MKRPFLILSVIVKPH
jgi:hypothetical protein